MRMRFPTIAPEFPPLLRRVALIMVAMMAGSLAFTLYMTHRLEFPIPFGVVWISGDQQWCDFRAFRERSLHFRTAAYWFDYDYPMTYPAAVAVILALFYKLPHPLKVYLAVLFAGWIAWVIWFARGLAQRGIPAAQAAAFALVILLTTWPVYYQFDTANIEGVMAIVLFLGILAILRGGGDAWYWTGTALLALAGAMKLFPAIMFALLLSKRRYKECAAGVVLMGLLNYGSLAIVGPSISAAQEHIKEGFRFLRNNFITPHHQLQLNFSHALYMPVKYAVVLADRLLHYGGKHGPQMHELALVEATLNIYMVVMAVLGITLYFWRIRKLPMLNQVLALTVAAVLFTPFSSDYTLNHLLLPLGLMFFYAVENWRKGSKVPGLETSFACICITLGFSSFFTIYYGFENVFRCLALCVLFVTALRYPFYWPQLDRVDATGQQFAPAAQEG